MSSTLTLSKTFEIELEDNTTINIMVCIEAVTEDEDFDASKNIRTFNYENVLDPIEELLTDLLSMPVEQEEDTEDLIG